MICGWCGSECDGVFHQQLSFQHIHPSLVHEGQSRVYHSRCVVASSTSSSVLAYLAQSSVWHSARVHKATLLQSPMSLTNGHLAPPLTCGCVNEASSVAITIIPHELCHTLLQHSSRVDAGVVDWIIVHYENKKSKRKKNGFTETRTQDPVCVRHM